MKFIGYNLAYKFRIAAIFINSGPKIIFGIWCDVMFMTY